MGAFADVHRQRKTTTIAEDEDDERDVHFVIIFMVHLQFAPVNLIDY